MRAEEVSARVPGGALDEPRSHIFVHVTPRLDRQAGEKPRGGFPVIAICLPVGREAPGLARHRLVPARHLLLRQSGRDDGLDVVLVCVQGHARLQSTDANGAGTAAASSAGVQSNRSAWLSGAAARSFADRIGSIAAGQAIPIAGSFHNRSARRPAPSSRWPCRARRRCRTAPGSRGRSPPAPRAAGNYRSLSSAPAHRPNVGDERRRSTATSNTRPRTARTSFPCGLPNW